MNDDHLMTPDSVYPWLTEHWLFFNRRLEEGRLAHALMIEGPSGSGKSALARAMVARLSCTQGKQQACGECRSCRLLVSGAHPDYFVLQPEEGSEVIKVEQVRNLIAKLDLTTSISTRKIALVHPAESMNSAAANALLKSLEEPAGDTVLILVSSQPGRLPVTIRSRCQAISVSQPDSRLVLDWLEAGSGRSREDVNAALTAACGSPLRALQYLDSPELDSFLQVREGLLTLLERPASVTLVSSQFGDLDARELWRWLSMCMGDVVKSVMRGSPLNWLPTNIQWHDQTLLQLQKQADINRRLSETPVRGDLLLQDWLIKWAEQVI